MKYGSAVNEGGTGTRGCWECTGQKETRRVSVVVGDHPDSRCMVLYEDEVASYVILAQNDESFLMFLNWLWGNRCTRMFEKEGRKVGRHKTNQKQLKCHPFRPVPLAIMTAQSRSQFNKVQSSL